MSISTASTNIIIGSGRTDEGARHRAVQLAQALHESGLWNGDATLTLHDPYSLHNKVFGLAKHPVNDLVVGRDYEIVDPDDAPPPTVIEQKTFDYAALDGETASFVQSQTAMIKKLYRGTIRNIMDVGECLLDVKERLDHGQFGNWLEAEFAWKERTAQNYMNVAKNAKFADLDTLPVSALYLIASPTAPDEAVEEIVGRAKAGEKVTVADVKSTLEEHKDALHLSDRDAIVRLLAENNGQMHYGILESRSKLHRKAFVNALQSLLDDKTIVRQGAFYQLASEATSNDVVALSSDLAKQIIPLVAAKADGITYADIRSGLELKQTDHHGLLALRRALDILLGSQQITKVGALYRVAESATAADETPQAIPGEDEPAPAGDLTSRVLAALRDGQQWTVPQLMMALGSSVRKTALIDTIEALIDAGKLVKLVGTGSVLPRIALAAPPTLSEVESTVEPGLEPEMPWKSEEPGLTDVDPKIDEAKITYDAESHLEATGVIAFRTMTLPPAQYLRASVEFLTQKIEADHLGRGQLQQLLDTERQSPTPRRTLIGWLEQKIPSAEDMPSALVHFDVEAVPDDALPVLILTILDSGAASLKAIGQSIATRTGQTILEGALQAVMNELRMAGEIIMLDEEGAGSPIYALAEAAAVPFKAPDGDEQPSEWWPAHDATREAILERAAQHTADDLRSAWHGQDWDPTDLHNTLTQEGLIEPVYKWSSGSRWLVGWILCDPAGDLEAAFDEVRRAIEQLLDLPHPDWSTIPDERQTRIRDQVDYLLTATGRMAFQFRDVGRGSSETVSAEASSDAA